jgi:hypothetical protein
MAVCIEELDNISPYVSAVFSQSTADAMDPELGIVPAITAPFRGRRCYYGQV